MWEQLCFSPKIAPVPPPPLMHGSTEERSATHVLVVPVRCLMQHWGYTLTHIDLMLADPDEVDLSPRAICTDRQVIAGTC